METKDVIGILLFCIICSVVLIWGITGYRDYKKEMASEKFNELPVYDKAHIKKYKIINDDFYFCSRSFGNDNQINFPSITT